MSEENNLTSEADDLPPASQKTKEQWLDEGHFFSFYAPIRSEEGLAAYEQAIRLDPTYGLAHEGHSAARAQALRRSARRL